MQELTNIKKIALFLNSAQGQRLVAAFILMLFFMLSGLSVYGRDKTVDEGSHYQYGVNILNGNSSRFDDSKMPVSAWNALPAKIAEYIPDGVLKKYLASYLVARLMTTVFTLVAGFVVFVWARKLYGFIPALVSLCLYVFDPNVIAHSQLVTTDAYAMGMILISSFYLWRFAGSRRWQDGLILAVVLGITQLTKYTALALYPLFAVALLLHDLSLLQTAYQTGGWRAVAWEGRWYVKYAFLILIVSILVINLGFLFNRTFEAFSNYQFRSEQFQNLQKHLSVTVPTPYPYLEGLDWVLQRERTGIGYGRIYLFGVLQEKGFPGYYLIAYVYKEPLATQFFVILAMITYGLSEEKRRSFWRNEIFLLLPVLFFSGYFNFFYNAQIGIRYYLVIFPLLFVFAGSLFSNWSRFYTWQQLTTIGLGLYLIASTLSYYPYYITYFNELVWDRTQAYKILADSNLDWGQSKGEADKYFAEHPNAKPPTSSPASGQFVVSVNRLLGIMTEPTRFAWLRENFEPTRTLANSYLIYDISQEEIDHLCATTNYCK